MATKIRNEDLSDREDKEMCEKIMYYIDINIFKNEKGETINNKIGLMQDLYDFVVLPLKNKENKK
jgi:hypothetical protein